MSTSSVREYVSTCNSRLMKTLAGRKTIASNLCKLAPYSNLGEMFSFVQEMRGLDFFRSEDRAIFCDFLSCWVKEVDDESSDA